MPPQEALAAPGGQQHMMMTRAPDNSPVPAEGDQTAVQRGDPKVDPEVTMAAPVKTILAVMTEMAFKMLAVFEHQINECNQSQYISPNHTGNSG